MPKKTKKKFINSRVVEKIEKCITLENNQEYLEIRRAFIDKFTLCDMSCKVVIEHYKKIKKRENEEIKLLLDMRVIPFAMQTCGYSFDRNLLNKVFGGSRSFIKKGSKSAKKLRDGIVHAMNEDDLKEMMARSEELFSAMNNYLSIMKNS